MKTIIVSAPSPYNTLCIACDNDESVLESLCERLSRTILNCTFLQHDYANTYSLRVRQVGGKGGFGSQLRAAGGRKSKANKDANKNAMADVSGRKLRTLQRAQTLISTLRQLPEQQTLERREKRDELLRIVQAEGKSERVLFQDEDYLVTSERLLDDLKRAMNQVHDDEDHDEQSTSSDQEDGEQGTVDGHSGHIREKESTPQSGPRKLPGWDDEDDFDEEESSDDEKSPVQSIKTLKGKEKAQEFIPTTKDVHIRKRVKAS